MNLETGSMAGLDDVGEGVEGRLVRRVVERRLTTLGVERVTAPTDLDEKGIEVGASRRRRAVSADYPLSRTHCPG
jgi:hypothetical protein